MKKYNTLKPVQKVASYRARLGLYGHIGNEYATIERQTVEIWSAGFGATVETADWEKTAVDLTDKTIDDINTAIEELTQHRDRLIKDRDELISKMKTGGHNG